MGTFKLELKTGKQIFNLDYSKIKDIIKDVKSIKLIKIIINKNYGSDRTYINQIMLFDRNANEINQIYFKENLLNNNNNLINERNEEYFNDLIISLESKMMISRQESEEEKSKLNETNNNINEESNNQNEDNYLHISQSSYNEYLEKSLKKNNVKINKNDSNIKKDMNKIDNINEYNNIINDISNKKEKKYLKKNIDDIPKVKKSNKVIKIETILKKNILQKETKRNKIYQEDSKYNYSNNNDDMYKKKYIFFDSTTSDNINKNLFPYTPSRYIINKNNYINNNIDFQERPYTPIISHFNINELNNKSKNNIPKETNNENLSKKNSLSSKNIIQIHKGQEKDYDTILQEQLKDLENHMNFLNKGVNSPENKYNYFDRSNNHDNRFGKTENTNFYKKEKIPNKRCINMSRTTYNKFYSHDKKNNISINNHTYDTTQNKYKSPIKNNYPKSINNSFNEDHTNKATNCDYNNSSSNIHNNNNIFPKYVLKDLASNNSVDINRRIDNLEKYVFDIKKEISSISSILSSGNCFHKNLKEQIKQICDEYLNEKFISEENIKYINNSKQNNNNYNNENHSLYSEFLYEENRQKNFYQNNKKFENKINKKIDKKFDKLSEDLKNQIYDKFLKPSIDQIENAMKKNIDEIKEILFYNNKNNNNLNEINNNHNEYFKKNKLLESRTSYDAMSKGTTKKRNEKYEEINRLGEQLYQKLLEKENKLRQLKHETTKYLTENN